MDNNADTAGKQWFFLDRLAVRGFKSIKILENFELRPVNVLIGSNGAGKSNLLSLFDMLAAMVTPPGNLQRHIAEKGGASSFLFGGPAVSREMDIGLQFNINRPKRQSTTKISYSLKLSYAANDALIFVDEEFESASDKEELNKIWKAPRAGHGEASLLQEAESGSFAAELLLRAIEIGTMDTYHFVDTSDTSRIKRKWSVDDNGRLKRDGGNLAPVLLRMQRSDPEHYRRIVRNIRIAYPEFGDFELDPEMGRIMLKWKERRSDLVFSAHQASDGMLRLFALLTLILFPPEKTPGVIFIDEPELGLHPRAIELVAGLVKAASERTQIVLATQSAALLDYFEPEDVIVVDREERASVFKRLSSSELEAWLEEYTLSELWDKNVLGGRP